MNVVMVHGFMDTGRLFRKLVRHLGERGHACHAPTLRPRSAALGIEDLSGKLEAYIGGEVLPGGDLALVGFSMGALVVRHYLQERGGSRRARAFFSVAGPHQGTPAAYPFGGIGARQMRPGGPFLAELGRGAGALGPLAVFTYRTPLDLIVFPARTTRIEGAPEMVAWCPVHSMLPGDPAVMADIAARLEFLEGRAAPPPAPSVV